MGESANLRTKCQKEYNSERSVVANAFGVFSSGSVYKIFNAHFLYVGRGKYLHINIDDVQVQLIILTQHIIPSLLACSVVHNLFLQLLMLPLD